MGYGSSHEYEHTSTYQDDINAAYRNGKRDAQKEVELEAENKALSRNEPDGLWVFTDEQYFKMKEQLAAAQADSKRLRDVFDAWKKTDQEDFSANIEFVNTVEAIPEDTSALDAFVAEKVKEYQERLSEALGLLGADTQFEAEFAVRNYNQQISELTRQRDLAVEALGNAFGFCEAYATQSETARFCVKQLGDALSAIRESEAKPCE